MSTTLEQVRADLPNLKGPLPGRRGRRLDSDSHRPTLAKAPAAVSERFAIGFSAAIVALEDPQAGRAIDLCEGLVIAAQGLEHQRKTIECHGQIAPHAALVEGRLAVCHEAFDGFSIPRDGLPRVVLFQCSSFVQRP